MFKPQTRSQSRRLGTACDRCYELKERCTRASTSLECSRCHRLGIICSTERPMKIAGRRPKSPKQLRNSSTTAPSQSHLETYAPCPDDITTWTRDVHGLSEDERELLSFLLVEPQNLDCYVVGATFQVAEQRALVAPLPTALPILKDAYLALAGALKSSRLGTTGEVDDNGEQEISLRRASSAMSTLMSFPVATLEDATLCLTLGAVLALYVYTRGVGAAEVCRYCLSTTGPLLEMAGADIGTRSWQAYLVLQEVMDCIVYRQKPTLRFQSQDHETVDRHLGLCLSLLQYFHDLCMISHTLRSNTDTSLSAQVHIQDNLDKVNTAIEEWQPLQHTHLLDQYRTAEVVNLLAQAKVFRLAGLLLGHRIRYAFGQQDAQADILAKEIMTELEVAYRVTGQPARCVTLPFAIAALEIQDSKARIQALQDVDRYVDQFSPVVQNGMRSFLERVWVERDEKFTLYWFDSVYKPCAVLDSLGATCYA